jgi:hypothetical protein
LKCDVEPETVAIKRKRSGYTSDDEERRNAGYFWFGHVNLLYLLSQRERILTPLVGLCVGRCGQEALEKRGGGFAFAFKQPLGSARGDVPDREFLLYNT